ncbi:hypothetical protein MASR2M15_11910 [Anaerolineales bacterium]
MSNQLDQEVHELWRLLFDIVTTAEKMLAQHMESHDLTPPQFFVLKTLIEHEGHCRIGHIAEEHHLTNATMTGIVKRLESMQPALVSREQSTEDRRAVDVSLTQAGHDKYWAIQNGLMEKAKVVMLLMPDEERHNLIDQIRSYSQWILPQLSD